MRVASSVCVFSTAVPVCVFLCLMKSTLVQQVWLFNLYNRVDLNNKETVCGDAESVRGRRPLRLRPPLWIVPNNLSLSLSLSLSKGTNTPFESECVFITAGPITKLFAWGEGDGAASDMCYERLAPVRNPVL
jgi:hypothetical protein